LLIADGFSWVRTCAGTTGKGASYGIQVVIFIKVTTFNNDMTLAISKEKAAGSDRGK
jgi:hypothetical protein